MSVTDSQFQLFKNVANPARLDMSQRKRRLDVPPIATRNISQVGSLASDTDSSISTRVSKKRRLSSCPPDRFDRVVADSIPTSMSDQISTGGYSSYNSEHQTPHGYQQHTAEKEAEKTEYLMEIQRMRATHPELRGSKNYVSSDGYDDVELEYNRIKIASDTAESVALMMNCLQMGVSGIEMANSKFGPWLSLDGFSEEACADMNKYKPALSRIYKRVWRRGCMNPWIELLMLLGGGVLMFHFKTKLLGPRRVSQPLHSKNKPSNSMPAFNLGAFTTHAKTKKQHINHGARRMRRPTRDPMPAPPKASDLSPSLDMNKISSPLAIVRNVVLKKKHKLSSPLITMVRGPINIET